MRLFISSVRSVTILARVPLFGVSFSIYCSVHAMALSPLMSLWVKITDPLVGIRARHSHAVRRWRNWAADQVESRTPCPVPLLPDDTSTLPADDE